MPSTTVVNAAGKRRRPSPGEDIDELVPNEEPPAVLTTSTAIPASVPVLYYTTGGGRAAAEVAIVTDSVGGQVVVSPSGRPADLDPKVQPVTPERLGRLRCFAILAVLLAPPVGLIVLLAFLRCRRAFLAADAGDDSQRAVATLWAGRCERLFVASMFFILAELLIVLLAVEYHLRIARYNAASKHA